jgi:hypothetical protein
VDGVADELEEEGDVVGDAFVGDALDPSLLVVVDGGLLVGRVVEEDLDAVGASFLEAADAPEVEEIGEAAGEGGVVAGLLIGEEQALAVAVLRGGQAELGIEEDGRGVFGEDLGDEGFEFFEGRVGDVGYSFFFGEGFLQRTALVHRSGGDHAPLIRYGFQSGQFSGGQSDRHGFSPALDYLTKRLPLNFTRGERGVGRWLK